LSATNLLGFKSRANILDETSIAITISIPRVVLVLVEMSSLCGLAIAVISAAKASKRITNNIGLSFVNIDVVPLKPRVLEILREAVCFFRLKKYHTPAMGSNSNSQKNCGFTKSTFSNIIHFGF